MSNVNKQPLNFYIEYAEADLPWVEWIAWQLEQAGYTVVYRDRDFLPGMNIVQQTDQAEKNAERVLIILSPAFLKKKSEKRTSFDIQAWTAAFHEGLSEKKDKLLPVLVRKCQVKGLLGPIIPIDLVGEDEASAHKKLLEGVKKERPQSREKPVFPGTVQTQKKDVTKPPFPPRHRPPLWHNVPPENFFFTDRENELLQIYEELNKDRERNIRIHVINGLGGIGKTEVARAYIHAYKHHYEAVFWINASNQQTLLSSLAYMAKDTLKLGLSNVEQQNQQKVIEMVKQWLEEHENWLLVLDNVEDPEPLHQLRPSSGKGHILITAQMQATGTMASSTFSLDELQPQDGALLLLKRMKQIETYDSLDRAEETQRITAEEFSRTLGNLPLLLDQAAAYIDETGIDLHRYMEYCKNPASRRRLLNRRGDMATDHRASVVETWGLVFKAVQQADPTAYDLLLFCSFLYPKDIPEEIITHGAAKIVPTLQLFADDPLRKDDAIAVLRKYSLLQQSRETRVPAQNTTMSTISMNHMVQIVLRDQMSEKEQVQWAEYVIMAVYRAFLLETEAITTQPSAIACCPRYFWHVHACTSHIETWSVASTEAAQLLYLMGKRLYDYMQHGMSDPPYLTKLKHAHIVEALANYATLLRRMERYDESIELVRYADMVQKASVERV